MKRLRQSFDAFRLAVWMVDPVFGWVRPKLNGVQVFGFDEVRDLPADAVSPFAVLLAQAKRWYAAPLRFYHFFPGCLRVVRHLDGDGAGGTSKLGSEAVAGHVAQITGADSPEQAQVCEADYESLKVAVFGGGPEPSRRWRITSVGLLGVAVIVVGLALWRLQDRVARLERSSSGSLETVKGAR